MSPQIAHSQNAQQRRNQVLVIVALLLFLAAVAHLWPSIVESRARDAINRRPAQMSDIATFQDGQGDAFAEFHLNGEQRRDIDDIQREIISTQRGLLPSRLTPIHVSLSGWKAFAGMATDRRIQVEQLMTQQLEENRRRSDAKSR